MKANIVISLFIAALLFVSCNNSGTVTENTVTDTDSVKSAPMTVLKVTKQFVTNADGSVTEIGVDAEVGYNENEISVTFRDSADKSFKVNVESMEKKVEGIHFKPKERKYTEIFISSGAQPQVTFSSDRGGSMTLM